MKHLELRIPPVAVFVVFGAVMWLAAREMPQVDIDLAGSAIVAGILATIGAGLGVTAILDFRRHETTVHPYHPERSSAIVTDGVYRYSRNPMYLGLAFLLAAWAAGLGNLLAWAFLPAFIAYMTRFQIRPEERALLSQFGSPFQEYMDTVRRWL